MLCSKQVVNLISDSEVLDIFSASDHRYLLHAISAPGRAKGTPGAAILDLKRGKLDEKRFLTLYLKKYSNEKQEILTRRNSIVDVDDFITDLNKIIKKSTVLKTIGRRRGPPAPWWNEEVAKQRKEASVARRRYIRERRKHCNEQEIESKLKEYKKQKKELNKVIRIAKRMSWFSFLREIDKDIWGRPYKAVMKSVKGRAALEILSAEKVKEVVNKMFIFHPENTISPSVVGNRDTINEDTSPDTTHITMEGVIKAAARLAPKKASGPDGITSRVAKTIGVLAETLEDWEISPSRKK
ncbi:uncharacterized protein LOC143305340 [Osmia lignaria lignaria]|uniref:uncharacterized protein LOC143305340 n=1 Tax=Osmia lignaria lignaria TaxID=1437193 RepID=UPI00402B7CCA